MRCLSDHAHSHELFAVSHETEEARRVWTYLPDGPFDNFAAFEQKLENWRISVIEAIYRKGLGLDVDKLNRSARQFLELTPLPNKNS